MHQEEQEEEEEDMETQGRLTRVTVESQVSGTTTQNQPDLPQSLFIQIWNNCQIYPSTSWLWIQAVPSDQVEETGQEEIEVKDQVEETGQDETEVKDQVEEETEVKSEDQTADVSQPDQKVRQVNPVVL